MNSILQSRQAWEKSGDVPNALRSYREYLRLLPGASDRATVEASIKNLEANRILLTYLALAFVFIFLSFRLRSVIRSLLSLVPVLIAVGTASLVAYAFSLKLSPMTAVGGPLIVALCTEFTSLILLRFIEERRRGLWPRLNLPDEPLYIKCK